MKKYLLIQSLLCMVACVFVACAKTDAYYSEEQPDGLPRLVVSGVVKNTEQTPLAGVKITLETDDPQPMASYNFALTDTAGRYTIIRYRGKDFPVSVSLTAEDPQGVYESQTLVAPVTYDSVRVNRPRAMVPYNAFVTADFIITNNQ
ncbi:MAG: hypothetical protein IJ204_03630 [Paludibacteraceae bacterium]|nr:hypothetical protein [Paludibacteraceae bacterium]